MGDNGRVGRNLGVPVAPPRARIGIVDDHPSVVLGVSSILNAQEGMQVAAWGATVSELLAHGLTFEVILLDLVLGDGSTPTTNLRALAPLGAPVLAYTSGDQPALVREASRAGAIGMIRKSELPSGIVEACLRCALSCSMRSVASSRRESASASSSAPGTPR